MKTIPPIVERNKDIEHIMHASCRWGLYQGGKRHRKLFAMLVTTDIHECPTQLSSAIDYMNYYEAIDCGICLGDIQQSDFLKTDGTWYKNAVMHASKPFMSLLGNHDVGNSKSVDISGSSNAAFKKFIKPTEEISGIDGFDKPHFVKLFDDYKVAIVGIDPYGAESDLDENGNYFIKRGDYTIAQEELDWLVGALAEIPSGYHLIVALHGFPAEADVTECAWTQPGTKLFYQSECQYKDNNALPDIIDAWVRGGSLCRKYEPIAKGHLPVLAVNCDFSSRGKGEFVSFIVGHYHSDIVGSSKKYPYQNVIAFPATALDNWQNYCSDLPREIGTKSEDAITVMSIDTDGRQVRLVRVGSDFTMDMTERKYTVIKY